MKVNGVEIPQAAIDAVVRFMQDKEFFIAGEIREVLKENGISATWSVAERIIQRERKAGRIVHPEGRINEWAWKGDNTAHKDRDNADSETAASKAPIEMVAVETVPVEMYNMAVAELAALQVKMQDAAENIRRYEKDREALNSYSHDLERQCDQWQLKFAESEKQVAVTSLKIEPLEEETADFWERQDRLPVLLGLANGNKLELSLSEHMASNLLAEIRKMNRSSRALCANHVDGELVVIDMQEVVTLQIEGLEEGSWQRPAPSFPRPDPVEYIDDGERERYRVECKCGVEYFCGMNAGREKARCRDCQATVFADRQAEPVTDPLDGAQATLLTNRYWVEREARSAPAPMVRNSGYKGNVEGYVDPCNPFKE